MDEDSRDDPETGTEETSNERVGKVKSELGGTVSHARDVAKDVSSARSVTEWAWTYNRDRKESMWYAP